MTRYLAHGVGAAPEASNVDLIVIAGGVVALGIAFIFQKSVSLRVSIIMVVVGVGGLVAGLTVFNDSGQSAGATTITVQGQDYPVSDLTDAVAGMCEASEAARSGDVEEARTIFIDRAHIPLHVIAAAVEDDDRRQAAAVLEAKERVETTITKDDADPEQLAGDIDELNGATTVALATLGITSSAC